MSAQYFFWVTLCITLASVVVFNRSWLSGLGRNVFSYPFEIFSYIYFIAVPIINVVADDYVDRSLFYADPVTALAHLNIVNAIGLLAAALATRWVRPLQQVRPRDWPTLGHVQLFLAMALLASLLVGIYNNFIAFNVRASSDVVLESGVARYILIESGPMLLAWLIVVSAWKRGRRPSAMAAIALVALFLLSAVAMNFTRGSRVTVLLVALLGFQLFHQYVFRLTKLRLLGLLAGASIAFNLMTIYKHLGVQGLSSYLSGEGVATFVAERYTDPTRIVIGDIGRADIQAALVEGRLDGLIAPAYGKTYAKALTLILPDFADPIPENWAKTIVGAQAHLQLNPGARLLQNNATGRGSSRIYGLVGEAVLNFGIWGILPAFLFFGYISRWSLLFANRPGNWEKALIAPFVSLIPLFLLFYDLDNIVFRSIAVLGLPCSLLLLNRQFQPRHA